MVQVIICYGGTATGKTTWIKKNKLYWFSLHDSSVKPGRFKKLLLDIDQCSGAYNANAIIAVETDTLQRAKSIIEFCEKAENVFVTFREFKKKDWEDARTETDSNVGSN